MGEYKHTNKMKKRKSCGVNLNCQGTSVKNSKRAKAVTEFLNNASETMTRQGATGAPNRALKQEHSNKFPDENANKVEKIRGWDL